LANSGADQVGTWCFDAEPEHCVTPLTAIRTLCGNDINVIYEPGLTYSRDTNAVNIRKAAEAAKAADIILFFAGEEAVLSGEARCRADISLPGAQSEMLNALKATGKPVAMIVMAGRPLTIGHEVAAANAVLYSFHGGTMAGPALADLLFGHAVPSGKLPISFPKMVGQTPVYYARPNTGRPAENITYINEIPVGAKQTSLGFTSYFLDAGDGPLFPFGYGKSYTSFSYGDVKLSASDIAMNDSITISCEVKNTGNCDGKEVVQLYVHDQFASVVRPVKELKGFQKIFLQKGASQTVSFKLGTNDLAFTHHDMKRYAEPGAFEVWVAGDSQSGNPATFSIR
jgi:beta-glucosidase